MKAFSPNGTGILVIPTTPGDRRSLMNLEACKRRCEKGV